MNFIEEKLSQLDAIQEDIDKMPCGDERAERVRQVDKVRRDIMALEVNRHKADYVYRIEDRIQALMKPDYDNEIDEYFKS